MELLYSITTITAKGTVKLYKEFQESMLKLIVNNKYKGRHNGFHKVTWRESTSRNMLWEIVNCTKLKADKDKYKLTSQKEIFEQNNTENSDEECEH